MVTVRNVPQRLEGSLDKIAIIRDHFQPVVTNSNLCYYACWIRLCTDGRFIVYVFSYLCVCCRIDGSNEAIKSLTMPVKLFCLLENNRLKLCLVLETVPHLL
jgi:hypothetical protein